MVVYELSTEACIIALLHAAKYPSCTVNGLLLGSQSASDSKPTVVTKAIPLFHNSHLLASCVETALTQVHCWTRFTQQFASRMKC